MTTKLKPCPFCGADASIKSCDGSGGYYSDLGTSVLYGRKLTHYLVRCRKCGVRTKAYATAKGVIIAWSRRVNNGKV